MSEDTIKTILSAMAREAQNVGQAFVDVTHDDGEWKIHFTSETVIFTEQQIQFHSIAKLFDVMWSALWAKDSK